MKNKLNYKSKLRKQKTLTRLSPSTVLASPRSTRRDKRKTPMKRRMLCITKKEQPRNPRPCPLLKLKNNHSNSLRKRRSNN
jgi:hypothetical protein